MFHRLTITILGTAVLLAVGSVRAVNITVQPGNFGYGSYQGQYSPGAGPITSGNYTFDATLNQWYTVHIQPANVGDYRVVDAGGGLYNVETRTSGADPTPPAGLAGSAGTASPTVSFQNVNVVVDRGVNYQGGWHLNWATNRVSTQTQAVRIPPISSNQNYQMFVGNRPLDTFFTVDGAGNVTVTRTAVNLSGTWTDADLGFAGGAGTLTFPAAYRCDVTVDGNPRGTDHPEYSWWQLDVETPSFNLIGSGYQATIYCYPGNVPLVGDIGSGSWLNSDSTLNVPLSPHRPLGYTETLTRLSTMPGAPEQVNYRFAFFQVPEPASFSLLAGAGLLIFRRRR